MGTLRSQKVTPVEMKVLLIAATLALASAGFAPSCDECNAAAAGLLARLTSPESIEEQTGILISQVCPQAADAAACEAGLSMWWPDMANCLPGIHRSRRRVPAARPLQGEERARGPDLRRLHRHHDPRRRVHEEARNHRPGYRHPSG